ncbi:hypothetical protein FD16_GL002179 [Paucilactobacillus suebicus DSM 5007 = KCTC 3549]|uniref:Uncharacterized protein n=2 Tax=Paucilactobacillus suebicus TaxID=152335 RepID=A0A0R1W4F6_9LACO|nr:hypothetical protein FD16_GL002179 [Paucilactobacillus suebicus DSM 5007 = KCTC 3549]
MITKYADDTFVEKYDFTLNDGTNFSLNSLKEFTHEKLMKTIVKTDRVTVHLINNQSTTIQL